MGPLVGTTHDVRCRFRGGRCAQSGFDDLPLNFHHRRVVLGKGAALLCGTRMDARGLAEAEIAPGARRSTMDELAAATIAADKVLVF